MYLCGPTVYDYGHLGHGRSAVAFDVIRRYLEYCYGGKNVTFVTNYTDIDDKMIQRAAEDGITVAELAEKIIPEYQDDYAKLGVKPPTVQTKATDYVQSMIEIIERLMERGHAYELEDGVYFEIEKFPEYGKLSKQKRDDLRAGARVEADDKKKHPHDFVLWKKEKPGEPFWESPWGKGRPGWHIECSAMSKSELGQPFDIHGGGMDLIFPHHEDEIAQSQAAYDTPFCRYWLHNGFINVNKEKMSKSLGNFFTLKDIFKKYDARVVRFFYLTAHYRSPIEFSDEQLEQSKNALSGIDQFMYRLHSNQSTKSELDISTFIQQFELEFHKSMKDDFDTPGALSALFVLIKTLNKHLESKELSIQDCEKIYTHLMQKTNAILNILKPNYDKKSMDSVFPEEALALIAKRQEAREHKNYAESDRLRQEVLGKYSIVVEDTPDGQRYYPA